MLELCICGRTFVALLSLYIDLTLFFFTRVFFGIPEIIWSVIGSVWILTGQIECEPDTPLPILMKGNFFLTLKITSETLTMSFFCLAKCLILILLYLILILFTLFYGSFGHLHMGGCCLHLAGHFATL